MEKQKRNIKGQNLGLIVIIANIFGVIIPMGVQSVDMSGWSLFLMENRSWTYPPQILTFIVPTLLCISYISPKRKDYQSRLINVPLAYAALGTTGWATYFIEECVFVVIAKCMGYEFSVLRVLTSSILYIILEAIITFTLAFFLLETIQRRHVLPHLYPDGRVTKVKGAISPGPRLLFIINYISVTLFPILYLLLAYFTMAQQNGIKLDAWNIMMLALVLGIGIVINFSFELYFRKPLELLKKRIQKIQEGDFVSRVNYVSNDAFGELADSFNDMTQYILEKNRKLQESQDATITGLAIMVEMRDGSTGGHIQRTSECIKVFARELKKDEQFKAYGEDFYNNLIKAAPMHDLGKVAVDDAILRKNGKFTDEEYEKMKEHAAAGAKTVERVLSKVEDQAFKNIAINVAHYHHEKWDGNGYPEKLCGTDIPFEARVMALADVFDALVSKRCYKEAFTYDRAFGIIEESLGTHFDPVLGELFVKCRPQLEALYKELDVN